MKIEKIVGYKDDGQLLKAVIDYPRKILRSSLYVSRPKVRENPLDSVINLWNYNLSFQDKLTLVNRYFPEEVESSERDKMKRFPEVLRKLLEEASRADSYSVCINGQNYLLGDDWSPVARREDYNYFRGRSVPMVLDLHTYCNGDNIPVPARPYINAILQSIEGYSLEEVADILSGGA